MAVTLEWLSAEERARCARLAFASDRRDFIAAHALLRHALSAHGHREAREWLFIPDATEARAGQCARRAASARVQSIPHPRAGGMRVAREVDVGIDIERVGSGTDIIDLARRHFSSAEAARVRRGSQSCGR